MWVFLIPGGMEPLLLGLRKERDQLQLCVIPGATQSAADTGKKGRKINLCFEGSYNM